MWPLPDDPRLPLAGGLVLLLVAGQILWHIRRHLVRRKRAEAILHARHLAWVARQEEADRQRDAEKAVRSSENARQSSSRPARSPTRSATAWRASSVCTTPRPIELPPQSRSCPGQCEGNGGEQRIPSCGDAETAQAGSGGAGPAAAGSGSPSGRSQGETEGERRRRVYVLIEVDREGWRRWRGSFDKEQYPRFWLGRKQGGWTPAYHLIYRWEQGPIPKRWTIDHVCGEKDCLDHLECVTRREPARSACMRARRAA